MNGSFDQSTLINPQPYLLLDNRGQQLRLFLAQDSHKLGRGQDWADLAAPEVGWEVLSRRQAILRKEDHDYRIYDGDGEHCSRNGLFVNQQRIDLERGLLLKNGMQIEIGQSPTNRILLTYCNPMSSLIMPSKRRLDLKRLTEWPVEIGRSPTNANRYASMQLAAPTVSRMHALLYLDGKGGHILEDRSTHGTFVDGKRIHRRFNLTPGSTLQIGPFSLLYRREALELVDSGNQIRLDVHRLCRKVLDQTGQERTILHDISLVIEPGQLVALIGGSGAGKSTLMKTLLGIEPTTSGKVFLNGDDLRQNWGIYRSQIGYVPQDDIVHLDLTVSEVLQYACKLRLPPDTDVQAVVNSTLGQVKLTHVRDVFVRDLSGGQRKRVSIGVELLADPKLFFLDEPTSGLDPGLDKEMMRLLRNLADQGRTVVLVTHATANIEVCDRIVFLGRGGKLCYFGPPQKALTFFEMPSDDWKYFSDIYLKLEQGSRAEGKNKVNYWVQKYAESPEYKTYIRLEAGKNSQFTADTAVNTGISPFQQWRLLNQRYWQLVGRDRSSLFFMFISAQRNPPSQTQRIDHNASPICIKSVVCV
jgi:ABC-type multidrug transport system ATPase subunit